jgi:hypothetical protein
MELALALKPHLNTVELDYIFVAIGAGDSFTAIRTLLKWVAVKRITVAADLARQRVSWLVAYIGHEEENYLRRLIEDFLFPFAVQSWATSRVNKLPTTPRPRWLAVSGTESAQLAQLIHHVQRGDLVRLRERRVVEHRVH